MSAPVPFDPSAGLGPRTLIEASAGTGKTYALASLAVRLIADGSVEVDELLVVTFARLAADELRDRIRMRMYDVTMRIEGIDATPDQLAAELAEAPDVDDRLARLRRALDRVDSMHVSTIHAFAQQAIALLGSEAGVDPGLVLVGTDDRASEATVADALAVESLKTQRRRAEGKPAPDLPTPDQVNAVVTELTNIPDLDLRPDGNTDDPVDEIEVLAGVARCAVDLARRRRQRAGVRNFSELLTDLRDALSGLSDERVARALRARFSVALIDEFQDTDQVQWQIFDTIFGHDPDRMVLVGDPKQAIYRFRGADVATYVQVAEGAVDRTVLTVNWRSDAAMVDALGVLFEGATFGAGIEFPEVHAAPEHAGSRIHRADGAPVPALSIRLAIHESLYAKGDDGTPARTRAGALKPILAAEATRAIHHDIVARAIDLLDHGRLETADGDRPITPGDLAILTRANAEGAVLQRTLRAAGIPAVLRSDDPVLESQAAAEWRILLAAVGRPSDSRLARAAALGAFGEADPEVPIDDAALEAFQERLGAWEQHLTNNGVAAFVGAVRHDSCVAARALAAVDGDRLLTDLDHIAELFLLRVPAGPSTVPALEACLVPDPDPATLTADRVTARRVESDDNAVQIMSIHKSKGLEFPIVFVVGTHKSRSDSTVLFHDPGSGRRVLDLRRDDAGSNDRAASEQRDDGSRALYVALTRAKHVTFVWWSHESNSKGGALTRLLFARDPDTGAIDPAQFDASAAPVPEPEEAVAQLALLVARAPEGIAVEVIGETEPARWRGVDPSDVAASTDWDAARLGRTLDRRRRRWSYTGITAHHAVPRDPGAETLRGGDDEGPIESAADPFAVHVPDPAASPPAEVVSRLATLPAGAAFGTLVHGVLERIDFTADDLSAPLATEIERELASRRLDLTPEVFGGPQDTSGFDLLRDGLVDVIASPLGELFDHATLGAFGRGARLNELDFELHLGASGRSTTDAALGRTVLDHLATDDPFRPWAEQLAGGVFGVDLAGSLNGSIDLVARVGDVDHPRFVIVDYKTNRLHAAGTIPTDGDYAMPSMVDAMVEHHYPLQALLYSVALHRFLRWRLPDYRPADHLGGAAYLFVRGMAGPETSGRGAEPDGVCRWVIPPDLVEALSDQLAGA